MLKISIWDILKWFWFFKDSVKEHILEWAGGMVAIGYC